MAQTMQIKTQARAEQGAEGHWAFLDELCLAGKLQLALIRRELPSDVTADDLRFTDTLSATKKQLVLRRLYAIVRSENGLPAADASRLADVTVPNFYRLKRLWTDRRNVGLTFLSGYSARKVGKPATDRLTVWEKKVSEVIGSQDIVALSVKEISKRVQEAEATKIPTYTLDAAARSLRQRARNAPGVLERIYGARVLIDYSAVSLVHVRRDGTTSLVEVAWVIEEASQLILAAFMAIDRTPCETQRTAISAASKKLYRSGPDIWRGSPSRISAIVPDPRSDADRRYVETIISAVGAESVAAAGVRRFGRSTLDVIGPVWGRIKIIPRATLTEETSAASVRAYGRDALDTESLQRFFGDAVRAHNRPIESALRASSLELCDQRERGSMQLALSAAINPSQ